eukprot:1854869-Pyramimonas_sp.AAC.1
MVREIGSDIAAMRTALAFIASLPAGGPAAVFGCLSTNQGNKCMTTASRLSPKQRLALQFLIGHYIGINKRCGCTLGKHIHGSLAAPCAESCALAH